jgi:putative peptidoglycan lipid II flippase
MAVVGVASVVERSIAATLGIGAISRLEYASKIFYIPSVVFDTNFVSFFLGEWSQLTAAGHYRALRRDLLRASALVFTGSCVIAGLVLTYRLPLVHLVLARGAFPLSETSRVASVVGVLILALPFYCAAMLLAGAAVALGENRLVMHVALVKVGIRSGGAALLAIPLGLQGIALAFVASHAAECVLYLARIVPVFRNRDAIAAGDISTGSRRPLQPATTAIITADGLTNVP